MVLYTPYDVNTIMRDGSMPEIPWKEITLDNGVTLLGRDVESGFMIERVLCGNSNAYLLPHYQPGTVIKRT